MEVTHSRLLKPSAMVFAAAVVILALGQGVARADELVLSVSTTAGPMPAGLNFTPTPSPSPPPATTGGSLSLVLGNVSLAAGADLNAFDGQQFSLTVTFNLPEGILNPGGQTQTFTSTILVEVDILNPEVPTGLNLDFGGTTRSFSFRNSDGSGSFQFILTVESAVGDTLLTPGGSVAIRANIRQGRFDPDPVPEPASIVLLATGLAGAVGAARRRRLKRGPR